MELGLASRSDLLQILNHTVHGGRSVLGQGDGEQNRRLDKSMFPSGSLGNLNEAQAGPASPATGNLTDSPVRMFQMDSPAASGLSSPGSLFPVSLERTQSSESMDFALAQEPSVAGGNVFDMTDTAHDDDNGPSMHEFRQAQPPPSPAAAEEQQQRLPEQLQQQQAQQRPPQKRRLYAYGIADPEYMSLPCKMSMKHARVTVNHETNSRLYGKKQPGQVNPDPAALSLSALRLPTVMRNLAAQIVSVSTHITMTTSKAITLHTFFHPSLVQPAAYSAP